MATENSILALNTLIEINNDRIKGYETASDECDDPELKNLFSAFARTSHQCKLILSNAVINLGGTPWEGTTTLGKFFRVWMDFKSALIGKNRKDIIDCCLYGEEIAIETYNIALTRDESVLTAEHKEMLKDQLELIKADNDMLFSLQPKEVNI